MKLNYITLKNFRSYYGEQTIHFATEEECHVTVIHGINGAGKTSLCIALNWCLYGDALVKERFGNVGKLASKHEILDTDTSVKIGFTYQGTQYWAERQYSALGNNPTVFSLKKEGDLHPHLDIDALDLVQSMIPEDVSAHFFFDGEKIDRFASSGHGDDLKSAVHNVLKLKVFQRGITHLKKVAQDYNQDLKRELAKHPPSDLDMYLKEIGTQQTEQTEMSSTLWEKQREVEAAKTQIQDIDKQLESIEESRELAEKRKNTEKDLEEFKKAKSDAQQRIRRLVNRGFVPIAKPVLDKALEILNKNEIPNVSKPLLEELLEQANCLCGRPIHGGSPEHRNILSLLERLKVVSSESGIVVRNIYGDLTFLLRSQVKSIPMDLKKILGDSQRLKRSIEASEASLQEIDKQLIHFDQNEVRSLQKSRAEYERNIGRLETKIIYLKNQIEKSKGESADLKEKVRLARASGDKTEQLRRYWTLANDALSAMEKMREPFAEEIRGKLQAKVQEIFKQLMWKKKQFQNVRLTKNFELQVLDRFGMQAHPEISAGEREMLSLAFIIAMAKMAAEDMPLHLEDEPFPIVMDTPFAKLSSEPRKNVTATVPSVAKQLVLFVTDEELHGQARVNLEHWIGAEYELQFDDESGKTKIKKIR